MKLELTNELKARFFAQHLGQEVLFDTSYNQLTKVSAYSCHFDQGRFYLTLTPLSLITDEDAIKVLKILGYNPQDVWRMSDSAVVFKSQGVTYDLFFSYDYSFEVSYYKKIQNIESQAVLHAYQYLQSKGYALPFMGISVEELVEAGWVKLQDK